MVSKEQRKDIIIKYILDKPNIEEKQVLDYCIDRGIGSKVTVSEAIKELLETGILNSGKQRQNTKSYSLSVNTDKLLIIAPNDVNKLLNEFKNRLSPHE